MPNRKFAVVLLVIWLIALAAIAAFAIRTLRISTDLRSFMPPPQTADQQLLMDQIGEGPGTRLLLLAMEAWTILPLEERLALHLVNLANGHGEREGDDLAIRLHMPQEQLAQLLGVTRQRISQILRAWERHGRLRYRYGHIVLCREWLAERAAPVHPIVLRPQRVPAAH